MVVQSFSHVQLFEAPWTSTPAFPVLHHLPEFAETHAHWVSDAIQPSHPLLSPSPPTFNLSQHQGTFLMSRLFASDGQSMGALASASVIPVNIQGWFPLELTGLILLQSRWQEFYHKKLKDIVISVCWDGPCHRATILFLGCSSLSLATVWICPLELREGHGGCSVLPTNEKQGTQKGFQGREPHRILLGFSMSPGCSSTSP